MADFFVHDKAIVEDGASVGEGTRIWAFANIQSGAVIGKGCNVCDGCFIEKGGIVGNNVTLKNGVNVFEGITLEDDVFCGMNTGFINDRFPRSHRENPWVLEPTTVKKGATVGCNSVILCGITIGEYAFIGAGSVVTRDVAAHTLVCGNPAQAKGYACFCGKKLAKDLTCECGKSFCLDEKGGIEEDISC